MIKVLFSATNSRWLQYETPLKDAFEALGLQVDLARDHAPETVDYIVYAPNSHLQDFSSFTKLKAVLNLWAGVEAVIANPTLRVPLCRMVEPGLSEGMVEWVVGHTLRYHLEMDEHLHGQDGIWRGGVVPPLARDRKISIFGLGELGSACACALRALNFDVMGWSRSQKDIEGVRCFAGTDQLNTVLAHGEISILLMPAARSSENFLNAQRLAQMPKSARIINPGRGQLIDDQALLNALDADHLAHATLDVFRVEPLPVEHPFWLHPKITVTPHIASETRAGSASKVIAENVMRGEKGESFLHLVDRLDH